MGMFVWDPPKGRSFSYLQGLSPSFCFPDMHPPRLSAGHPLLSSARVRRPPDRAVPEPQCAGLCPRDQIQPPTDRRAAGGLSSSVPSGLCGGRGSIFSFVLLSCHLPQLFAPVLRPSLVNLGLFLRPCVFPTVLLRSSCVLVSIVTVGLLPSHPSQTLLWEVGWGLGWGTKCQKARGGGALLSKHPESSQHLRPVCPVPCLSGRGSLAWL